MNQNEKAGAAAENTAEEIENLKGVIDNLLSVIDVMRQKINLGEDEVYVDNCIAEAGEALYGDEE